MESSKGRDRIYLKDSKHYSGSEFFHSFAEHFVFFRWSYFKNRPRTTFLLVRAFLTTGLIFALYYTFFSHFNFIILGVDVDPILLFVGFGTVGYWNMNKSFAEKSKYCFGLYNEIFKERGLGEHKTADILSVNFCAQLLTLDLWAHRAYSHLFNKYAVLAIQHVYSKKYNGIARFHSNEEEAIDNLWRGNLSVSQLRKYLFAYQDYLLGENNEHLRQSA